jgi:hypothetical protein
MIVTEALETQSTGFEVVSEKCIVREIIKGRLP